MNTAIHPILTRRAGTALWVREVAPAENGLGFADEAASVGAQTSYVKAADGTSPEPQFSLSLVSEGCSEVWPSLKTSDHPTARSGVMASLLSSINLP